MSFDHRFGVGVGGSYEDPAPPPSETCEYYGKKRFPPPYLNCQNCSDGVACYELWKNDTSKQATRGENE